MRPRAGANSQPFIASCLVLCGSPTYFLAYRDAARVFDGMRHQEAYAITGGKVPDKLETSPLEGRKTLILYYGHERELKRLESGSDTTS